MRPQLQAQAGAFDYQTIRKKLEQMVSENRLQHFYPPQRLDALAQEVAAQNVIGLGQKWRLPKEVSGSLAALKSNVLVLNIQI